MEPVLINVFAQEILVKDLLAQVFLINGRALALLFGCFLLLRCVESSAANRHIIFCIGLLSTLLLPISSQLIPAYDFIVEVTQPITVAEMPEAIGSLVGNTTENSNYLLILLALLISYFLVVMVILLKIIASNINILLQTRLCYTVKQQHWITALSSYQEKLNIERPVDIKYSTTIDSPMTWGVFKPVILLPSHALYWPDELIASTLLHELAHIKRNDWLTQQFARCICAIYWINPLCWKALERLRLYAEMATDDLVLYSGVDRTHYASALVNVAERLSHNKTYTMSALAMTINHEPKQLRKRVTAVLNSSLLHLPLSKEQLINALFFIAIVLLPFTSLRANYVEKITFTLSFPYQNNQHATTDAPPNLAIPPEPSYLSLQEIRDTVFKETGWHPKSKGVLDDIRKNDAIIKTQYNQIDLIELVNRNKSKIANSSSTYNPTKLSQQVTLTPIYESPIKPEKNHNLSISDKNIQQQNIVDEPSNAV